MKKLFTLVIIILLMMTALSFAGDVPEALLSVDSAKVFIGKVTNLTFLEREVTSSLIEVKTAEVMPTFAIKGDIELGVKETFNHCDFGAFIPEFDKEYLFGYIDENNFYIYEIESWDKEAIKLVNSENFDMTKRLENYLNEGTFKMAEEERRSIGEKVSLLDFLLKEPVGEGETKKVIFNYKDNYFEVDKEKFLALAGEIKVTNVKNTYLHEMGVTSSDANPFDEILFIELWDKEEKIVSYMAVSCYGEVDRYIRAMGRLMTKDFEMEKEDAEKLYSLMEESELKKENNYTKTYIVIGVVIAVLLVVYLIINKKRKR